jgi:hypothetical protein
MDKNSQPHRGCFLVEESRWNINKKNVSNVKYNRENSGKEQGGSKGRTL